MDADIFKYSRDRRSLDAIDVFLMAVFVQILRLYIFGEFAVVFLVVDAT
jgi:hypothetical protein